MTKNDDLSTETNPIINAPKSPCFFSPNLRVSRKSVPGLGRHREAAIGGQKRPGENGPVFRGGRGVTSVGIVA